MIPEKNPNPLSVSLKTLAEYLRIFAMHQGSQESVVVLSALPDYRAFDEKGKAFVQ